ncbi:MAG: Gfo/Idh/MocA family oxidoreductase [bacterium]|nr:Gfo/Idh/MocA family oxidoreductase [bacterium]
MLASALPTTRIRVKTSTLRVGLLGCGTSGTKLLGSAFKIAAEGGRTPHIQLVALADLCGSRLQQTARSLKGSCPSAYAVGPSTRFVGHQAGEQLLRSQLDVVVIALPVELRTKAVEQAVRYGKHAYVEHCLANSGFALQRFQRAEHTATAQNVLLHVGSRTQPAQRWAACLDAIQQGILGAIREIQHECQIPLAFPRSSLDAEALAGERALAGCPNGLEVLEARSTVLEIADALWRQTPRLAIARSHVHYAAGALESRIDYEFGPDERLLSHCRVAPQIRNRLDRIQVVGERGSCDLQRGKLFDLSGRLITSAGHQRVDRGLGLNQFLTKVSWLLNSAPAGRVSQVTSGESEIASKPASPAFRVSLALIMGELAGYSGETQNQGSALHSRLPII